MDVMLDDFKDHQLFRLLVLQLYVKSSPVDDGSKIWIQDLDLGSDLDSGRLSAELTYSLTYLLTYELTCLCLPKKNRLIYLKPLKDQ